MNIHGPGPKMDISGSLYAQQLSALFDYLEAQNRLFVDRATLHTFDLLKDVNIEFRAQEAEWIYYTKTQKTSLI
ncbi:MAG: hypothetical protein R3D66_06305 [Alphaproteobacteria bacterium]